MKRIRKFKRWIAGLLVITLFAQWEVVALAKSQSVLDELYQVTEQEERAEQDVSHYEELLGWPVQAKVPEESIADEASKDYSEDWMDATINATRDSGQEMVKKMDKYFENLKPGEISNASREVLDDLFLFFDNLSACLGVAEAIGAVGNVIDLQGETVGEQIVEVVFLTAKFAIAATSIVGIGIPFPMGMIVAIILDLLIKRVQDGSLMEFVNDFIYFLRYKLPSYMNVYKPNIYLYSKEPQDVEVSFEKPQLLTETIPKYQDSWKVRIDANSNVTDASGSQYGYLFYECMADLSLFQKEEGYYIEAKDREEQFRTILTELNFNKQEIDDFVEFWDEKLEEGVDYIMYPQNTKIVDQAMPMTIQATPESTERIWFVFSKDVSRNVKEPEGYALKRGGKDCKYYVVEWGGLFDQE